MIINIKCKTQKKKSSRKGDKVTEGLVYQGDRNSGGYIFSLEIWKRRTVCTHLIYKVQAMYSQLNLYVFCLYSKTLLMYSHLSLFDVTPLPLSLPLPPFPQTLNHSHTIYISIIYIRSIPMKRIDYSKQNSTTKHHFVDSYVWLILCYWKIKLS